MRGYHNVHKNIMNPPSYQQSYSQSQDEATHAFLQRVYLWMTGGVGITALVGSTAASIPSLAAYLSTGLAPFIVLALLTLGMVIFLSARIQSLSASTAAAIFILYAALNGLLFTPIFLIYTEASLGTTFLCTAGTFGVMSLYGAFTKKNLSGIGRFLMMSLFGLIICSVVNIFFHNNLFTFITSIAGVVIFSGLTAYDTQRLVNTKDFSIGINRLAILGALTLYLDFINLFLYLLRFMGKRN